MVPPPEERNLTHSLQENDLLLGPQSTAQEQKSAASVNEATVWVPIYPGQLCSTWEEILFLSTNRNQQRRSGHLVEGGRLC